MPFLSVVDMMRWFRKVITAIILAVVVVAAVVLAILNPQILTVNLWGWIKVEHTIAAWLLIFLAVGILIGVSLASVYIIKLQSRLYVCQRKLRQQQDVLSIKENKK